MILDAAEGDYRTGGRCLTPAAGVRDHEDGEKRPHAGVPQLRGGPVRLMGGVAAGIEVTF